MKKFFIILLVVIALFVGGTAIFLSTFNWNWAKQILLEKVQEQIGRQISVDKISFSFHGGSSLELHTVTVQDSPQFSNQPCLTAETLRLQVNLIALFRKQIEIKNIQLKSFHVRVIRNPQGVVNFSTLGPSKSPNTSVPKTTTSESQAPLGLIVSQLSVSDGSLEWIDQMQTRPFVMVLDRIDLNIRAQSIAGPFDIEGKARWMSKEGQNLRFESHIPADAKGIILTKINASADLDLTSIDWSEMRNIFPELAILPLEGKAVQKGKLQFHMEGFIPNQGFWGSLRLQNFLMRLKGVGIGVESDEISFVATPTELKIDKSLLKVGQGTINTEFVVQNYLQKPIGQGRVLIQNLDVNELLPPSQIAGEPRLRGLLNGTLALQMGVNASGSSVFQAEGQAEVTQAVLENMNLANMVFGKISVIPGLREEMLSGVSPYYQNLLKEKDTVFQKFSGQFNLKEDVLYLTNLIAATADYGLEAQGTMNREQIVQMRGSMKASQELTNEVAGKIKEIVYLTDFQNRFTAPFKAYGLVNSMKIEPDLGQIAQMIIARKGREQVDKSLQKILGKKVDSSSASSSSADSTSQTVQNLLQDFLR